MRWTLPLLLLIVLLAPPASAEMAASDLTVVPFSRHTVLLDLRDTARRVSALQDLTLVQWADAKAPALMLKTDVGSDIQATVEIHARTPGVFMFYARLAVSNAVFLGESGRMSVSSGLRPSF